MHQLRLYPTVIMLSCALRRAAGMKLWYIKGRGGRAQKLVGGQSWGQRKQLCQSRRLRGQRSEVGGQTLLGLTFFRLLSSSSSWRIRTSLVVSSSFSRRNSSCCRKNIRRSYVEKDRHSRMKQKHFNKQAWTARRNMWRMCRDGKTFWRHNRKYGFIILLIKPIKPHDTDDYI